ncbi:class I SAM-dependent DNA methyltransferase [Hymenobacter gummosus]|uniref:site-specific DNA-methyltransferase (adenine-specific) n=1 Tax=Hymenobacter gummosus TaxID=1776032 RepID=A0A431U7F5_9BACT|nr:Eco57I restriction-modification methylase domain-containing protein [Hymenobacter gummosus]RTQ52380.1 class I SAM-dependent DNA methyltransferase [Hymenobacter gummosus]
MKYQPQQPSQALDLAYRRQKVTRATLDTYEAARRQLLTELDAQADEADIIEPIRRFLQAVGFSNYLNSRKKRDLVMHTGASVADPIGIIFELKHAKNKGEMVQKGNLNRKALHELLLYYFQERTSEQEALELRQLIITNGYEWFVFDAHEFHRVFWKNTELRTFFQKHQQGQTTSGDTKFFYDHVKALIDKAEAELPFTHFTLDVRDDKGQRKALGERGLLWQAKLFSAPHLLKEPFAQDANTLNRAFYEELLYLMGLEEVKEKNRKLIQRCAPGPGRQRGSLLENTLVQLRAEDMLRNLPAEERATYGDTPDAQAEGVALALCLTWVSRLLFLKLLEGQLRRYHAPHDAPFRFLDPGQLKEYDQLNLLFYRVLNRPPQEREAPEAAQYRQVPYLNSSLFEPSALERVTLRISGLDDRIELPLLRRGRGRGGSVLQQEAGSPAPLALTYLLRFLDAYDFASEGEEAVQEGDDRPLISAAVLGLIFEKINGYRDGSFYTPGFITMYMCRHTLRRAVVRHFNERYAYRAESIGELRELLDEEARQRPEFSRAFNELRVCDPAVGSGHFLVSALNELLAIKSELGLLLDDDGKRLRYSLTVARDELAVVDDEDDTLFEYRARLAADGSRHVGKAHTRLQSALFREKRHLIEHCLYGVDLNPNSVRICRLRLWIELLKHAYYTPASQYQELETLPNLDLNVRAGNSLIGRYPLGADLTDVFRRKDTSVAAYRRAFAAFFSARGREQKQELQDFLTRLKEQFRVAVSIHDPLNKKLKDLRGQLAQLEYSGLDLFGKKARSEQDRAVEQQRLQMLIDLTQEQLTEKRDATLYRDAFEWRFEFPEILNPDGSFRGFDAVIGNPPYIRQEELAPAAKKHLAEQFETGSNGADLYVYFMELGTKLLAPGGEMSFITSNKWLNTGFGEPLRRWLPVHTTLVEFIDFGDLYVFPQVKAYPAILTVTRQKPAPDAVFRAALIPTLPQVQLDELVALHTRPVDQATLRDTGWHFTEGTRKQQVDALMAAGTPLKQYVDGKIYRGLLTGLNEAFVIDSATRERLVAQDAASAEVIKPFLAGRDLKRYQLPNSKTYLILLPSGCTRQRLGWKPDKRGIYNVAPDKPAYPTPWDALLATYPAIAQHLQPFEAAAAKRTDKGQYWWELRACDYYDLFAEDKIMWKEIAVYQEFALDTNGTYANNKTFFIPGKDLYLLGVLNSASIFRVLQQITTKMKDNAMAMQLAQISQLPIPPATPEQQAAIAALVEQVLAAKAADAAADTTALERQIDALVAALYGLTAEEAALLGG